MKHATWLFSLLSVGVVFVLCMSSLLIQPIDLSCGQYLPLLHESSQLASFISKALHTIQDERHPLCVLEVGTADGTGTTVSLYNALQTNCNRIKRGFQLYTYEVSTSDANKAEETWLTSDCARNRCCVTVVNEIVLDQTVMGRHIMEQIDGPESDAFPGKAFYKKFYTDLEHCIGTEHCGGFFHTKPPCTLDLVLIDGTRFSHAGIMQTILQTHGLTKPSTLFIIEDDFWTEGKESDILKRFWNLIDFETGNPDGEQWPWAYFHVAKLTASI